ncbi:MAG: hypothetical protein CME59_22135 [Halioglobus sp.]|nr:hypothetical protein [Halioglobus sp.]|tara:strand:- start:9930 stop:12242 length:2313 start_codon:yes stop_codon:yes gene_type:complete
MQALINVLLHRRHLLTVLTLVLGAVIAYGTSKTRIDPSYNAILDEEDPYRAQVEEVEEHFPPSSGVLFAFMPRQGDIFTLSGLRAMEELTERYTDVLSSVSVSSVINYRLDAVDADLLNRDYLVPDIATLDAAGLERMRRVALADEGLTDSLLSAEGDLALASIRFRSDLDDQEHRLEVGRSVVALRDSLRERYPDMDIYVLGRVLFELDSYNAQINDRKYLAPVVAGISVLLLWYCLRSVIYSLCVFAVAFVTIGLTTGTMGWANLPFNQISNMGPLVVLTIAMADGIHIVAVYIQGLHRSLSKVEALRESLAVNIQPVTLATLTTTMGFLSLNYCSSPGIYGFGNVVAIGVCWAWVVTLTLLPGLLLLVPVRKIPKPLGVRGFIGFVQRIGERRGGLLLWGSVAIIVATLAMLPLNRVDFTRFSFIDKDSDIHKVYTALSEKIGNDQSLIYAIDSGEYYGITEPEFLLQVEAFSDWLEAQPEASFVNSYTRFLKTMNRNEHDNDEAYEVLPTDKLQVIDYLVSYQLVQEIEPNLTPIFDTDYAQIRMVIGTSNLSNAQLLHFNERIEAWIEDNLDPGYRVLHGDNSILFARLDRSISLQLLQGFSLSFLLITATMLVGLRSLRYGLLSIMPNLFPATIVFGVWGLLVGELSPYVLMLFSISIGLVVDDSVHVLSKYIHGRRKGSTPEQAVRYSLDRAGSAITITTLALGLGTLVLAFSNTYYYQNVAMLLTPIIIVALLLDLFFLPPLLVRFDNWWEGRAAKARAAPA